MYEAVMPIPGTPYRVHQHLEALTKEPNAVTERTYQFMIVEDGMVLVRSATTIGDYNWRPTRLPEVGERVRFFLRALPIKKHGKREGRVARKFNLRSDAERREWINSRLEKNGMRVEDVSLISDYTAAVETNQQTFFKHGVDVLGSMTVTDENLFRHAMLNGIGEAKPYGFGTLMILDN